MMMSDNHKIVQAEVVEIERIESDTMHPLVKAAVQGGTVDPDTLSKLMDLQERYERNQAKKAFNAAMVQLKRDLPTFLQHDKTVDFTGQKGRVHYTHTSLAKAVDEIVPHLNQYGFSHSWIPTNDDRNVTVVCRLTHVDGHHEDSTLTSAPDMKGGKSPAQGIASTITLLERYSFLALLGIATTDMTESDPREPAGDAVNTDRNLEAISILKREGIELSDAQAHLQKDFQNWTTSDLTELGKYIRNIRAAKDAEKGE